MTPLPRAFYERDAVSVGRDLLGRSLVRVRGGVAAVGRIVEVEAYLGPHDRASHSASGRTPRTAVMFGPAGHAYVYLIYGLYCCLNVVVEPEGRAAAVLIRALEPLRNIVGRTSGPGLLCRALNIDRRLNGCDLLGDQLFITGDAGAPKVVARPRIGVGYAGRWSRRLLRFYIRGNRFVSRR